jgi:S-DNA-T family DNA segregation ATPase FtsK/SpoIIIE
MQSRELLREILGVVLAGAGAFGLAAIASFDVADLPWRVAPATAEVANWGGSLGAALAYTLIRWVGTLGAFGAAAAALAFAVSMLRRRLEATPRAHGEPLRRVIGALVVVFALALVERIVAGSAWAHLVERGLPAGGVWGLLLEAEVARRLGALGAPLAAGVVGCVGAVLLTDRPLRELLGRSVEGAAAGAEAVAGAARDVAIRAEDALASTAPAAEPEPAAPPSTLSISKTGKLVISQVVARREAAPAPAPVAAQDEDETLDDVVVRDETPEEQDEEVAAPAAPEPAQDDEPQAEEPAEEEDELVRPVSRQEPRRPEPEARAPNLPPIDLLAPAEPRTEPKAKDDRGRLIEETLAQFKVPAKVMSVEHGPSVALFALELGRGVKVQRVAGLLDNLALALRVPGIRLQAPIPGTGYVGLEVPNEEQEVVRLRELLEHPGWAKKEPALPVFLGKDSAGRPLIADLAKMPHLLIAGATGSGKSVCINSIIVSLLMTRTPREVQLILIDPKQVEMTQFQKVPHLLAPVVTDMRKAGAVLDWAVRKMEERYGWLAKAGVRHIREYNALGKEGLAARLGCAPGDLERQRVSWKLPYVVVVVDELNDLMMIAQKEVEASITRLAQKSRAVGIHVVLATQRPSVDVITGVIKSNLPARLAFRVTAKVDSRTILDMGGADKLLGMGDMLFLPPGRGQPLRALGALVTDDEVASVVKAWSREAKPDYSEDLIAHTNAAAAKAKAGSGTGRRDSTRLAEPAPQAPKPAPKPAPAPAPEPEQPTDRRDPIYTDAVRVVLAEGKGSVSLIQRKCEVGYGRAARYLDLMAEDGLVGPARGAKPREVKVTLDQWETLRRAAA